MLTNDRRKRSQPHPYELHSDVTRTHTHESEVYAGPIRKYTQVDVGGMFVYR